MNNNSSLTKDTPSLTYSYFPGCSLHSTGLEYGLSTHALFRQLGISLVELSNWNCCGASSAHTLDPFLSIALPARNLALAQQATYDLAVPCAACFNRIKHVQHLLAHNQVVSDQLVQLVGIQKDHKTAIRHLLDILHEDFGCLRLAQLVKQPLKGLKVAAYYGCLLVRPPNIVEFDDPDNPQIMANLLRAIGVDAVEWSDSTECCGGSLSLSRSDIVYRLVGNLVKRAQEAGALAVVTACPLCQVNLEMRQDKKLLKNENYSQLPVFYFTELIALALGIAETKKWWGKHLIDPRPLLVNLGLA